MNVHRKQYTPILSIIPENVSHMGGLDPIRGEGVGHPYNPKENYVSEKSQGKKPVVTPERTPERVKDP